MRRSVAWLSRRRVLFAGALIVALPYAGWQLALVHRPAVARTLVEILETRFERAAIGDWSGVTGVVVPGGNPVRTREAMRLARQHAHLRVVISGPSEHEIAIAMRAPGVSADRILIEQDSLNTYGNAWHSRRLVEPKPGERWLLVTSASHMPRAIGSFLRVGFPVEPWPVLDGWTDERVLAGIAQHEWLGLIAYWARGRTIAVFPGQADVARLAAQRSG